MLAFRSNSKKLKEANFEQQMNTNTCQAQKIVLSIKFFEDSCVSSLTFVQK